MPLLDMYCESCEYEDEILHLSHWDDPVCPGCDALLIRDARPVVVSSYIGYSAAGTDYGIRGGTVFHSAAERRAYDEKHKISGVYDKNSIKGRSITEEARVSADEAAVKAGHKNHESYRKDKKRERLLKKGGLASFDRKVMV